MTDPSILLVSNGHGEAEIARAIGQALRQQAPSVVVEHFPLVGALPQDQWPRPVGPQAAMPSGGLVAGWNVRNLWRDVRAGLLGASIRQYVFLRKQKRRHAIVAVGDIYCLCACLLFTRRPTIFVPTAKSDYVAPHSAMECAIARRAAEVFARDEPTARSLVARGVRARYAGNAMMDAVAGYVTSDLLPARPHATRVGVLPGSRADAPANAVAALRRMRRAAQLLRAQGGGHLQLFISVAPSVDPETVLRAITAAGISIVKTDDVPGVAARAVEDNLEMCVIIGRFGEVLHASDLIVGQAGTANEQAAGLGRPVVAAADPGERIDRMGWYRMRQQRLLNGALAVLPADDEAFAQGLVTLIRDPARRLSMARIGRERMGGPGASEAIAGAALRAAGLGS